MTHYSPKGGSTNTNSINEEILSNPGLVASLLQGSSQNSQSMNPILSLAGGSAAGLGGHHLTNGVTMPLHNSSLLGGGLDAMTLGARQIEQQQQLLAAKYRQSFVAPLLLSQSPFGSTGSGIPGTPGASASASGMDHSTVATLNALMQGTQAQQIPTRAQTDGADQITSFLMRQQMGKIELNDQMNSLIRQQLGSSDANEQLTNLLLQQQIVSQLQQAKPSSVLAGPPAYRDASLIPDPEPKHKKGRGGASEPFPQKLHRMLSELEEQENGAAIASFLPHGRAFCIHNPKKFVNDIMPTYFRMSRFSSFQRQLNLYDFKRITEGRDKGAYYHELFLRGRAGLCGRMKRTKIKGAVQGGFREEINFYNMPPIQVPPQSSQNQSKHGPDSYPSLK
eukprot:CAMPEP_0118699316 /NCGR_PEP_ID=MMETSP0800-20121206/15815_1 /TAXON_ID=210618 ORGANISM="Striatella unipunctata, Strain CCMP2910" /NCGR_SAMPLE_ID=MMETSP0800 /ASSEMBLY_ACC=CAM_ASM_000638 /LENGTH=392 /DNA_ID=CAMNT_0006599487 /DNA_START=86 /DNA_END=1264 /DNA_ORIENTATION=-